MGEARSTQGDTKMLQNFGQKAPEGSRARGRPRHNWEENIRMDFGEIELEDVDSI